MTAPQVQVNSLIASDASGDLTMSSRDIAELTGKEHKNVLADIRKVLTDLGYGPADFSADLPDSYGRPQAGFKLPKRETLILVSGYSVALRAKIIDRWDELERQVRQPVDPVAVLNDPAAMRGLLLNYSEKVLALQAINEELAPKALALDRLATAEGSMCVTDAAKLLQIQPKALFNFLKSHGWIYSRVGSTGYFAYQAKLSAGLLEHKTTTVERSDGTEKVVTQVRVTPKGLTRLAKELQPVARAA